MGELTPLRKKFCQMYVANGGNGRQAYMAASKCSEVTANGAAGKLLRDGSVRAEIDRLMKKHKMPKDFFVKKMRDLADAQSGGEPDNGTQFKVMEMGLKLHGLIGKEEVQHDVNVNYNLNMNGLDEALEKLGRLTQKLELSDCPDGRVAVDAIYREGTNGETE